MIKVKRSPSVPIGIEEKLQRLQPGRTCKFTLCRVLEGVYCRDCSLGELAGLYCVVLAGTSEGLAGPKVLEGARCRCCGTK